MSQKFLEQAQPHAAGTMETETIQKNGASPKSPTSRKNNVLKFFAYAALSGGMALATVSCDRDNGGDNEQTLSQNTISAKWEIANPASKYASFEFNRDGNYIVIERIEAEAHEVAVKSGVSRNFQRSLFQKSGVRKVSTRASSDSNLSPIHFGTYKIEGDKIILSGFGVLEAISITAEEFTFSFTLEATGEKGEFVANRAADPISSSSRTDMFCRTWRVDKITIDESAVSQEDREYYIREYGADWKNEVEKMRTEESAGLIALFSKAGTYLVLYANDDDEEAGLSEWKWTNGEETAIYYSWDNWKDDWTDNIVQVKELSNSTLIIQEEESIYHLTIAK
jgi:hypothetical protein